MTEAEERLYLEELLLESARWTRDPDEPYCSLELEIRDRLRRLNHVNTVDNNGLAQSVVERGLARQAERDRVAAKWHPNQVRVKINGKSRWTSKDLCVQVPCAHSKNGMKWVLRPEADNDSQGRN